MAWTKWIGIMASGALVSVAAFAGNGCSSSSGSKVNIPNDGSTAADVVKHPDSGSSSGGGGGGGGGGGADDSPTTDSFDGTTGTSCTMDSDCRTNPNGPGINLCSNDVAFTGSLGDAALYPTPICIMPGMCDPTANGMSGTEYNIAYCDGNPTDPASPGICYPQTNPPTAGKGTCFPQCNFSPDGSAATGCQGTDACQAYGFGTDTNNNPIGIGICYGGCTANSDCSTAGANATMAADKDQQCDVLYGICSTTVTPPTSPIGAGCNQSATTSPCDCVANPSNGLGFCSAFCKSGGTTCPTGWICDLDLPLTLTSTDDAQIAGWTMPNSGMGGFCAPGCALEGGKADTDSGACPSNSDCQAVDVGGPDCLPLQ